MAVVLGLWCVAALFVTSGLGLLTARSRAATAIVYGACLAISAVALSSALIQLLAGPATPEIVLPLGLPWVGAHFKVDALSAFFLVVVNLGGATASLYALGYGRHETAPQRVLPFYPAFLGAMNLVVLADDAFTFLFSWEFMSLTSWALVMAHHRVAGNKRAGYVYLIMASFGTMALLLAFGLLAGPQGGYAFAAMRAGIPCAFGRGARPRLDASRRRIKGRSRAAACLAAARPSGGAKPCLGADERRHDQGRGLWLHPHRLRPARPAELVVEHDRAGACRRHRPFSACSMP